MLDRIAQSPRSLKLVTLMQRAQNGDREAFCALVNEIGPAISAFLRRRIADANELEDVCQETLLAIYESRHTYEPTRPLEPWIFAIARHVGATHFKRQASRTSWEELKEEMPENSVRDSGNLRVRLQQAMTQLTEVQRAAFVMTKIEGLSLVEASERSGTSVGALKVRMHRAFASFKKSILG